MTLEFTEKVREALKLWDGGLITLGELKEVIFREFWDPVTALERGETVMAFGSCCCKEHAPDRTFKVEVTIQPHGYTMKRIDPV